MKGLKILALSLAAVMLLVSAAEAAVVGYQGRHFQATSGRGGYSPLRTPCCYPHTTTTSMGAVNTNVPGTFDVRTTGFVTSMTTSGTLVLPAGNSYLNEMPFKKFNLIGEVNPTNGALTLPGQYGAASLLSPGLPPGWVAFIQTRTTVYQTANFGPGQGPGNYQGTALATNPSYHMSDNPYTRMGVTTTTMGVTNPTTINWVMKGRASGSAGPNQFGGTLQVFGRSANYIGIIGPGTVREISFPVPYGGAGAVALPNHPLGVDILRSTTDSFVRIHLGTLAGTIVASIVGPVVADFFPWTTGTIMQNNTSVVTKTLEPLEYGIRTEAGSDSRTVGNLNGNLQMVTGWLQHSWTGGNPVDGSSSIFTRVMDMSFVPEPGSLGLIGSGVLGLLGFSLASRKRR